MSLSPTPASWAYSHMDCCWLWNSLCHSEEQLLYCLLSNIALWELHREVEQNHSANGFVCDTLACKVLPGMPIVLSTRSLCRRRRRKGRKTTVFYACSSPRAARTRRRSEPMSTSRPPTSDIWVSWVHMRTMFILTTKRKSSMARIKVGANQSMIRMRRAF